MYKTKGSDILPMSILLKPNITEIFGFLRLKTINSTFFPIYIIIFSDFSLLNHTYILHNRLTIFTIFSYLSKIIYINKPKRSSCSILYEFKQNTKKNKIK